MKVCESEDQLETLMKQAGSEAKAAFGDATVYIEKYLGNPRHIEFQVFGDGEGNGHSRHEPVIVWGAAEVFRDSQLTWHNSCTIKRASGYK